ncbi:MAG: AAA family ATPase [Solirubrobacteraceae bacterium]
MRLHRLALRNYRGVRECEVEIPAQGVTVIQGPNEIGKSSLAEAINLLLDEPDGSAKARVRDTKPVDRDVGPEVELELATGPYRVVYAKRWISKPMTTLTVREPKAEQLTGRAAHNRMKEILEETLDEALWAALRHQQGESVAQAALGQSRTLAASLDAVASGGALGGEDQDGLWSKVEAQRESLFTSRGKPSAARVKLETEVRDLEAEVARLQGELRQLEDAAERDRELGLSIVQNGQQQVEQKELVEGYRVTAAGIRLKQQQLTELGLKVKEAELVAREAKSAAERREEIARAAGDARTSLLVLAEADEHESSAVTLESAAKEEALTALQVAEAAAAAADRERTLAASDQEHCRNELDCEQLKERLARVNDAEASRAEAQQFLDSSVIDASKTAAIQAAVIDLQAARTSLEGQAVSVQIVALRDLTVALSGQQTELAAAERFEAEVAGETKLTLEGIAEISVTAGGAQKQLSDAVRVAGRRLSQACEAAGVGEQNAVADANEAERKRETAESAIARAGETLEADLRDLTPELMDEKIKRLEGRIVDYLAQRTAEIPLPTSLDDAKESSERAESTAESASLDLAKRRGELTQLEGKLGELERAATERRVNIEAAQGRVTACDDELSQARDAAPDAAVQASLETAAQAAEQANNAYTTQESDLQAHDPAGASLLLENAEAVLKNLEKQASDMDRERAALRRELEVRGEAGLHDKLATAETALEHRTREHEQTERRAAAAELLYEVTKTKRDEAKRAYAAPFRSKLEDFARIVFGQSTAIEVDHEDLRVLNRTLEGTTVPYNSLSVGTREQICVLSRLACACLVADNPDDGDGAPLIFDDALGNADPQRLERLGAVINTAGKHTQIVVLTCTPDRYRNVGSGAVIRL